MKVTDFEKTLLIHLASISAALHSIADTLAALAGRKPSKGRVQ